MSRWWRAYEEAATDPKLQLLNDGLFRAWFNIMCIASKNDGQLPPLAHVAYTLQIKPDRAAQIITQLCGAGLLDKTETGFVPHNWNGRQYRSDKPDETAAERMRKHRERKRISSVTVTPVTHRNTVTVTVPRDRAETEQKDSEANASGAVAPIDHRKRLFNEGLEKLAGMTGKGPDACRSFVGKCLKASSDDAVTVLGLIEEAERNRVVDPSAWIAARLKTGDPHAKPRSAIIQAADDLRRKIASFDGPASEAERIRGGEGEATPRMLSHG